MILLCKTVWNFGSKMESTQLAQQKSPSAGMVQWVEKIPKPFNKELCRQLEARQRSCANPYIPSIASSRRPTSMPNTGSVRPQPGCRRHRRPLCRQSQLSLQQPHRTASRLTAPARLMPGALLSQIPLSTGLGVQRSFGSATSCRAFERACDTEASNHPADFAPLRRLETKPLNALCQELDNI